MSILKYMFDNDWEQRRDIEELREQQHELALQSVGSSSGGASERWVGEIASEVKELAATVQVLMQMLAEKGGLDIAEVERRVADELAPRTKARSAGRTKPAGPVTDQRCGNCDAVGASDAMVRVGACWFCRDCARNP